MEKSAAHLKTSWRLLECICMYVRKENFVSKQRNIVQKDINIVDKNESDRTTLPRLSYNL